jgi:hypothetical protein
MKINDNGDVFSFYNDESTYAFLGTKIHNELEKYYNNISLSEDLKKKIKEMDLTIIKTMMDSFNYPLFSDMIIGLDENLEKDKEFTYSIYKNRIQNNDTHLSFKYDLNEQSDNIESLDKSLLIKNDLIGPTEKEIKEIKSKNVISITVHNPAGMTCCQCDRFNEYVTESNQDDGKYKCYGCKIGF